ncbi:MAG: ECF transporter S component [Clostridia bacterium]|nr:ECF transporter S component [Clostridia bacterium]
MNDRAIRRLAAAGVLCAVTFVLTAFMRIPLPAGYLNLGDFGVFFAALTLPTGYAVCAAGVGSMLADLYSFPVYAPATLLIKGLAALLCSLLWRRLPQKLRYLALLSALLIPVGYGIFEWFFFRAYAAVDFLPNLLQATVGAGLAIAVRKLTKDRFTV